MRIASVQQVELGNIMALTGTGVVLKWARQSNLSEKGVAQQSRWILKNHIYLTVARQLREKTHPGLLIVTLRRGICSAALKQLVKNCKDQAGERSVVVLVLNTESAV